MKALSVRNPWAAAIIHLGKDVENRTWTTQHRGRIAIHASLEPDRDAIIPIDTDPRIDADYFDCLRLDAGKIIGTVNLVSIHRDGECPVGCNVEWAFPETGPRPMFHWILRDPHPFETPWAHKGALQLWEPDVRSSGLIKAEEFAWLAR